MINHLAVIIDGNRRWAKQRGMHVWKGHEKGIENVDELINWGLEIGIKEITIYALSIENLKRDKLELSFLFRIFKRMISRMKKDKKMAVNKVKVRFIGDLSLLPKDIAELAKEVEKDTSGNNNLIVNFCFAYGGRQEIIQAFNKLKNKENITEEDIKNALWLKSEPNLIIRTGNQKRLSGFLPWQSTYSELIFLDKMWPDFNKEDLINCIKEFDNRKRNFGK